MKSIILSLILTFSINCYSQKQKNSQPKDTLYLKSGEKITGYYAFFGRTSESKEIMCSKKNTRNKKGCKTYLRKDIDKIIVNVNSFNDLKPENGMLTFKPLDFKQVLIKKYRNFKSGGLPAFRLKGTSYDFYEGSLDFFQDTGYYVFLTKPSSDKVIDFIYMGPKRDYKKLLKNAEKRFNKCKAITVGLEQKKYKKDTFNVSKILDKCGEILTK